MRLVLAYIGTLVCVVFPALLLALVGPSVGWAAGLAAMFAGMFVVLYPLILCLEGLREWFDDAV